MEPDRTGISSRCTWGDLPLLLSSTSYGGLMQGQAFPGQGGMDLGVTSKPGRVVLGKGGGSLHEPRDTQQVHLAESGRKVITACSQGSSFGSFCRHFTGHQPERTVSSSSEIRLCRAPQKFKAPQAELEKQVPHLQSHVLLFLTSWPLSTRGQSGGHPLCTESWGNPENGKHIGGPCSSLTSPHISISSSKAAQHRGLGWDLSGTALRNCTGPWLPGLPHSHLFLS